MRLVGTDELCVTTHLTVGDVKGSYCVQYKRVGIARRPKSARSTPSVTPAPSLPHAPSLPAAPSLTVVPENAEPIHHSHRAHIRASKQQLVI